MADMSITAANVQKGTGAKLADATLGTTCTAGQVVYEDLADSGKLKLADATSATKAAAKGILLNGGANNQPAKLVTEGPYTTGGTVVVGQIYAVSATAGGICPVADLTTGNYPTILGIGISATQIDVLIHKGGVAKP